MEVQRNLNSNCDSCQQCDYEIEYADHSSSMGVLTKDDMHLVIANGDRAKLNFVFGYGQQTSDLSSILLLSNWVLICLFFNTGVRMINKANF